MPHPASPTHLMAKRWTADQCARLFNGAQRAYHAALHQERVSEEAIREMKIAVQRGEVKRQEVKSERNASTRTEGTVPGADAQHERSRRSVLYIPTYMLCCLRTNIGIKTARASRRWCSPDGSFQGLLSVSVIIAARAGGSRTAISCHIGSVLTAVYRYST